MAELVIRRERKQARYFVEKLGDTVGLDMILVPGGPFIMGSPADEPEHKDTEEPQHEVTVPTFFMGRYPITQEQWRFVAGLPQIDRALDLNPSRFKGNKRPVEQVSWYDAFEFCDRLSAYTKREYRLPTEAKWEYACRAGTTTPFYFGKTLTTDLANYDGRSTYNNEPQGVYREGTTPVDHFDIANAFGLCDMHGNVWEWCQDHWHNRYAVDSASPSPLNLELMRYSPDELEHSPPDGSAWLTEDENASRVVRGGSWLHDPRNCRSAYRFYYPPGIRDLIIGFRVVCVAPNTL